MAQRSGASILQRFEALPIIVVFILLLLLFMYRAPEVFLAPYIYTTFLSTLPPLILLATGLTFVIGAGEIDLCFPSIIAFSGFVFAILFKEYDLGWLAVVAGLASGIFVGFLNGLIIAKVGIPSFMTTLATQFFWAGMATVLSGGKSYALRGAEDSSVWQWIVGRPFASASTPWLQELSIQALWTAIIVGFLWLVLTRHRFGEHTLFIGDSNDVSRVVGIDVDREKIKIFTLMGFLAACAAIILTLENKNFFGNQGQGYLLTAIASVLIGGTSIFGGQATILGTVFGCFIIGMVEAGLVASGLTGAWVRTVQGLIFLVSIIFYMYADEPQRRRAPIYGRSEGLAVYGLLKREGFADRGGPNRQGRNEHAFSSFPAGRRRCGRARGRRGASVGRSDRQRPRDVHANGRQRRRWHDARTTDRR
jgi:simple sugar transport system permease protein